MTEDTVGMMINEYWYFAFIGLLILILWAIINTYRRWDRIAGTFGTNTKIKKDDWSVVHIDGRVFRKVIIYPLDEGLYLAQWPMLARLILHKRILIPWNKISGIDVKQRSICGIVLDEYYVDVSGTQKVQLQLPKPVAEQILNKNFLKKI